MVGASRVEDILLLLDLTNSPLLVHGTAELGDSGEDGEQTESDDGLFVQDVELVADGRDRETGTGGEDRRLRDERVAGESIDEGLSLLLGILGRDAGRSAGVGDVQSRESADGESCWADAGGP